ncbi:MAG: hypothetical protein UW85_C0010G0004 [Parcubacteria group bacterium GW2011_GWA1_Parcubacteria_45_10]|nr:MAG: hypothetical protein UW85_C0010G0004 [Parcubacteria group bacterium GW2011_GWA1_Parcubacteria_45_10]KKT88595.1 MAG: hypothetical protein UW89_C0006G0003 [Parcubacteria group bacterium GW2011_GWB1_45_10]
MNITKILLHPPEDDAPQEEWEIYWAALAEAERQAEASEKRIRQILAA